MLQRSIDYDPFGLTIEEKIYRSLKRLCTIFAVGAVSLGVLDMTNIRTVDAAVEFLHDSSARIVKLPDHVATLPDRIRNEIRNISLLPAATLPTSLTAQATVSIPRSEPKASAMPSIVVASAPTGATALPETEHGALSGLAKLAGTSPVDELAAARKQDALEMAMMPPAAEQAVRPASQPTMTPAPAAAAALATASAASSAAAPAAAPAASAAASAAAVASRLELPASLVPASAPAEPALSQLAAAEPAAAPEITPKPTPVSLPMSNVIPLDMVPMPRPAPGPPPPSPAERLHLEGKTYVKAERCLANAIYFEARSEPVRGQMAVAQVVLNRVFSGFYPHDVCSVIYQNADRYLGCQFTFACDGKRKLINERGAWARANRIAKETLDGQIYVPEVGKSTHYHAVYVHPNWVREMHRLFRYGEHAFYRPIAWGNGADEPVWGSAAMAQNKGKAK